MPGETAAAGTTTGKTGTPSAETAGTAFNVTVNAVDANWNVVNTVTDTVDITSTRRQRGAAGGCGAGGGDQDFQCDLQDGGQRDGDGHRCDRWDQDGQHQSLDHGQCGRGGQAAVADAG